MKLETFPISQKDAFEFIKIHHRHHLPPQGSKFQIGAMTNNKMVGCIVVGRPVSRHLDDGFTAEVTRMCSDGTKNVCSFLYAAAWRVARAMGYKKLITYILESENGSSLKASGWKEIGRAGGGSWSVPSRPRKDKHPLQYKIKFERAV